MNEHFSSEGKYGRRLLHPNLDLSLPIAEPDEEIYQVHQPLLQLQGRAGRPELYTALADSDPASLLSFFGISFETSSKSVQQEGVQRLTGAYEGKNLIVPFEDDHLLFPLAKLRNDENSLEFIASASVANATSNYKGRIDTLELQRSMPYFLLYLVHPNSARENSFKEYVEKQFQFAKTEPVANMDSQRLAYDITTQLFTMVRGYQSPSSAALFNG
jgi:hypothetical protein